MSSWWTKTQAPITSGNQPPSAIFSNVALKNDRSMMAKKPVGEDAKDERIAPAETDDEERKQRIHEHRGGDRYAVGAGEARRRTEADHRPDHHRAEQPV